MHDYLNEQATYLSEGGQNEPSSSITTTCMITTSLLHRALKDDIGGDTIRTTIFG